MTRRQGGAARKSVTALAALSFSMGAVGCTWLLSLDGELSVPADGAVAAADAPITMVPVVTTPPADGSPPADGYVAPPSPPPPDYCTAKGWHFDCAFGTYGVVRLDETPALSPPVLTRAGTTLIAAGSGVDGKPPFLYSITNGQATALSTEMLAGSPVDVVYGASFGAIAILVNLTSDAGITSPAVFVLSAQGKSVGQGGGAESDVSDLVGRRLVAVDSVPNNPLGYSLLVLANREGDFINNAPVLIRTNYPVDGSTVTPIVTDGGPSLATGAVENARTANGVTGWIASRPAMGGLITRLDDGFPSFSEPSPIRFSDALGVDEGVIAAGVSSTGIGAQVFLPTGAASSIVGVDDDRVFASDNLRLFNDNGRFVAANAGSGNLAILRFVVDAGSPSVDVDFGTGGGLSRADAGDDDDAGPDAESMDAGDANAAISDAGDAGVDASTPPDGDGGVTSAAAGLIVLPLANLFSLGKVTRLGDDICASVTIGSATSAYAAVVCAVFTP